MDRKVDVVIIGAGHAGLNALKEVRKVTDNYVLVNGGGLGTTCARNGCMPSKVALQLAEMYHERANMQKRGIEGADQVQLNQPKAMDYVRDMRETFIDLILANTTDEMGDELIEGYASFVTPEIIEVNGERIETRATVIATGSRSATPGIWKQFQNEFLYSENIFELTELPRSVAVIGLGPIGIELGQVLHRLGVEVTGFGDIPNIARIDDPVINQAAIEIISREFPVHVGHAASIEKTGDHQFKVKTDEQEIEVEKVLLATGRMSNLDKLGLLNFFNESMRLTELPVDPYTMQLANYPIFIAGDANCKSATLQVAADEGRIAGFNAARNSTVSFKPKTHMSIIFSDPNIISVGKSWSEINEDECVIGQHRFGPSGRAIIMGKNRGMLRIYANRQDGKVLGGAMIGPRCEHLAHLLSWSVQQGLTVQDMLRMPYYHPVIEEALQDTLLGMAKKLPFGKDALFDFEMISSEHINKISANQQAAVHA